MIIILPINFWKAEKAKEAEDAQEAKEVKGDSVFSNL